MDSLEAFMYGDINRGKEMKVFDWLKAVEIIKSQKPDKALAGLQNDMDWTGGPIYRDGKVVPRSETYTYLASTWSTPILVIDDEEIPCFKMQSETPEWDSSTYWPQEALAILEQA